MNIFTVFLLALALSADAFTVSVTNGLCFKTSKSKMKLLSAFCFGFFQGIMPYIGYKFGNIYLNFISFFNGFFTLFILTFLGLNMIFSSLKDRKNDNISKSKSFSYKLIFLQAFATSIDALSVGIALAEEKINIINVSIIIFLVTFLMCIIALKIGKKIGDMLKDKAEIIGGIILILIGIKLFFGF